MADQNLFLGIDVGGTKVHALLADASGRIIVEAREPTATQGGAALIAQLKNMRDALCRKAGISTPCASGLGLPAAVDPATLSLSAIPNIDNMAGAAFVPQFVQAFGGPVAIENDVNCAALAEAWVGQRPSDPLAFIAIGTGIGMGLVVNGGLLRGANGLAGEIAFLPFGGDPTDPALRQSGTLESRLGGEGWRQGYLALGGRAPVDLPALFAAPDAVFKALIARQADLLAQAILTVQAVISPQAVVLGGSIGAQEGLLAALQARLPDYLPQALDLSRSALAESAGALGAARAAMIAR